MHDILRDLRYSLRTLRRSPGFTLAALLTLALGIGANTAVFSLVHGVLLRPLSYPEASELTVLWARNLRENIERDITSYPNFTDWQSRTRVFESMAANAGTFATLTGAGEPEQLRAALVTQDFFRTLGVTPAVGRVPAADEHTAGGPQVVVLSHGVWQERFGADPSVAGRTISLNGDPYTVVGVMPRDFAHPEDARLWMPLEARASLQQQLEARGALWLSVIGRLAPGVELTRAQNEMTSIAAALEEEYPDANEGMGVFVEPLHETIVGDVRPALLVLLGAVAFVLLIACANVANLLLARGAGRRKELAVRIAIGAERGRIIRQLVTESLVLAVAGGATGLLLASWAVSALAAAGSVDLPRIADVRIDPTVALFTVGLSIVAGILFGLAPALQAAGRDVAASLRQGGREDASGESVVRLRPILVVAEIALALVLLSGAGLMIRSFAAMAALDPGFNPDGVLTVRMAPSPRAYPEDEDLTAFWQEVVQRVGTLPGVRSAGAVSTLFLARLPNMTSIAVEGAPPPPDNAPVVSVAYSGATPGYLDAFGLRLAAGRDFDTRDRADGQAVAIVNETFLRQFMPEGDPIGRRFTYNNPENPDAVWQTVIGVIRDAKRSGLDQPVRPEAYHPTTQFAARSMTLLVRTGGDPLALAQPIRSLVRGIDADMPIARVATVNELMSESVATRRLVARTLLAFSVLATVLAGIGIYGVMAYLVGRRTRELGIRMALGADPGDVVKLVLRQAGTQIAAGLVLGVGGAITLTRFLSSQLFGVSPTDPLTLSAVAGVLAGAALLASWVPARRAARVDPMRVMRAE